MRFVRMRLITGGRSADVALFRRNVIGTITPDIGVMEKLASEPGLYPGLHASRGSFRSLRTHC